MGSPLAVAAKSLVDGVLYFFDLRKNHGLIVVHYYGMASLKRSARVGQRVHRERLQVCAIALQFLGLT